VEQQQRGIEHERARDREHLLLAAGELKAEIALARTQAGKQLENPLERPAATATRAREHGEVLAHRQARKNAALLRHETEAEPRHRIGRQRRDIAVAVANAAGARLEIAHDGEDGRGLARAVAAEQADHLALPHRERDPVQDVAVAVIGVDVLEIKHWSIFRKSGYRFSAENATT